MVRHFSRSLDVLQDVFAYVEEALQAQAAGRLDVREIQLVVEELFTNCLRYNEGGKQQVEIGLERRGDRLVLEIVDRDVPPFDVTQVPGLTTSPWTTSRPLA